MDSWEAFFREKSAKRSVKRNYRWFALWTGASVSFALLLAVLLVALQSFL